MCPGNGTSECAVGMGLVNVPREWDYPMCHVNGTSQSGQRMGLYNVP